jgi:hypothetical protein
MGHLDRPVAPEMNRAKGDPLKFLDSMAYSSIWKSFAMTLTNPLTSSRSTWKVNTPFSPCLSRNLPHPLSQAAYRPFFNSRRKHPAPFVSCAI